MANELNIKPVLTPSNAYALIEAARAALDVTGLGLGVSGTIHTRDSLYTVVSTEGFCALLNLIVIGNEFSNICTDPQGNSSGRYIYLLFRLASTVASIVGLSLISKDLASIKPQESAIVAGTVLIALGLFTSHALTVAISPINLPTPAATNKTPDEPPASNSAAMNML